VQLFEVGRGGVPPSKDQSGLRICCFAWKLGNETLGRKRIRRLWERDKKIRRSWTETAMSERVNCEDYDFGDKICGQKVSLVWPRK